MLPVKDNNVVILDLKKENKIKKEEKYIKLLQEQLYWLNRHKTRIYNMSQKLYNKYINNTLEQKIVKRCCNFPLLEEKCEAYNKKIDTIINH